MDCFGAWFGRDGVSRVVAVAMALGCGNTGGQSEVVGGWWRDLGAAPQVTTGPEEELGAVFAGRGPLSAEELLALSRSGDPEASRILEGPAGERLIRIHWEARDGEGIEKRTAELLVKTTPEPGPAILGGGAVCLLLLRRKRPAGFPSSIGVLQARVMNRPGGPGTGGVRRSHLAPPVRPARRRARRWNQGAPTLRRPAR